MQVEIDDFCCRKLTPSFIAVQLPTFFALKSTTNSQLFKESGITNVVHQNYCTDLAEEATKSSTLPVTESYEKSSSGASRKKSKV